MRQTRKTRAPRVPFHCHWGQAPLVRSTERHHQSRSKIQSCGAESFVRQAQRNAKVAEQAARLMPLKHPQNLMLHGFAPNLAGKRGGPNSAHQWPRCWAMLFFPSEKNACLI